MRRSRGCAAPLKRKTVWKSDFCPTCGGDDPKCMICKGTDSINMTQCPRAQYKKIGYILEYYADYKLRGVFPDKRGRFYQPKKLTWAFNILDIASSRIERNRNRDKVKENKNGR